METPAPAVYTNAKNDECVRFAQGVNRLIKEKGINTQILADAIGVTFTAVRGWTLAKKSPRVDVALRVADYFGVSLDDLFGREGRPVEDTSFTPEEEKECRIAARFTGLPANAVARLHDSIAVPDRIPSARWLERILLAERYWEIDSDMVQGAYWASVCDNNEENSANGISVEERVQAAENGRALISARDASYAYLSRGLARIRALFIDEFSERAKTPSFIPIVTPPPVDDIQAISDIDKIQP